MKNYAEFWCPSCRKFIERECLIGQKILRQHCENAGRVVKMVRRAQGTQGKYEGRNLPTWAHK